MSAFFAGPATEKADPWRLGKILLRLWHYLHHYQKELLLLIACNLISNSLGLLGPLLAGRAIDAIAPGQGRVDFPTVYRLTALMLLCYALAAILEYALARGMIKLSQRAARQLREDAFDHLADLPAAYFDRHLPGEIVSHLSYDIDVLSSSLAHDLTQISTSLVTVLGSLILMLRISPRLSPVFLFTLPAIFLFTRYKAGRIQPYFRRRSASLAALNAYTEEIASGHKTIKAYHRENVMLQRFDQRNDGAVNAYYLAEYYGSVLGPSVNLINNLTLTLVSGLGALLFLSGRLGIGSLTSLVLYSRKFSGPVNEAANIFAELQSAVAAAERLFRLLDEPPEKPDEADALFLGGGAGSSGAAGGDPELGRSGADSYAAGGSPAAGGSSAADSFGAAGGDSNGGSASASGSTCGDPADGSASASDDPDSGIASAGLAFSRVHFGYEPDKAILRDLSFLAAPGQLIAIVGPTGAGKTSIVNLLLRFYDPWQGQFRLDGHPSTAYARQSLRGSFAMVLQESWFFQGTVLENILYGQPEAGPEAAIAAAKAAQCHDFILQLPQGYQTVLREDGGNLSQGQKQLLTIARAMLLPARILILDEATSSVDTRTERRLQEAMSLLRRGKTCFVIAHRLSTVQKADQILVLQDGRIAERGTHAQLLARQGVYAAMFQAQFR
ncbi:MAG: ABC transporter ATP-binding protein/permease [Peptococcaceae bacterium]|jgi:ATP-binding cassette subfamily B protein|nr:ABC transporter ATP-binding protein/permease [Peptococcaceae bacterium]